MINILVLVAALGLGYLSRSWQRFPGDGYKTINAIIIQICLPALIFRNIHSVPVGFELIYVAVTPWIIFLTCAALFLLIGLAAGWPKPTIGAVILTAGLGNNALIGLPLIEAAYGPAYIGIGAISAQLGINLATNTVGIVLAALLGNGASAVSVGSIARRIALFPPTIAFCSALLLKPMTVPPEVIQVLDRFGLMLGPLAMLSIGMQTALGDARSAPWPLGTALVFKLVAAPVLAMALVMFYMRPLTTVSDVIVFQAAMAPQSTAAIVAAEFGLNRNLAALVVSFGTIGSAITIPFFYFLMHYFH